MVEMIERVALAISGSDDPANILSIHRTRARAAIEAMREPTDLMIKDGSAFVWFEGRTFEYEDVTSTYQAMIDAALKSD